MKSWAGNEDGGVGLVSLITPLLASRNLAARKRKRSSTMVTREDSEETNEDSHNDRRDE